MPAVLNAANEVAVERFLAREIGFEDVARIIGSAMRAHAASGDIGYTTVADLLAADASARAHAAAYETHLRAARA